MAPERLQKLIARAGVCSRRDAEELIREGRVTVNGRPARLGEQADLAVDSVKVDGKRLKVLEPHRYILLCKPPGVVTTTDDPGEDARGARAFLARWSSGAATRAHRDRRPARRDAAPGSMAGAGAGRDHGVAESSIGDSRAPADEGDRCGRGTGGWVRWVGVGGNSPLTPVPFF